MAVIKELKTSVTGVDMFNAIRNSDSVTNAFKDRIPEGTLTNLKDVQAAMEAYPESYNEFVQALINRIGKTVVNSRMWSNPLAQFKQTLELGQSVQEIQVDLVKAAASDPKNENNPFAKNIPNMAVVYHNLDKQNIYTVTINEDRIRTAFVSWDALRQFNDAVVTQLFNSYYYDDYLCIREVLHNACTEKKGLLVSTPLVTDESSGKAFLGAVKLYAEKMGFMSDKYNAMHFNTFSQKNQLVLFVTPDTKNVLDVQVLAYVFQAAMANIDMAVITVDELPYGVSGMLCDVEFLRIYNYTERMTSQYNPKDLSMNYFLNVRNIYSSSILKNCVIFADPARISTFQIKPTEGEITGTTGGSLAFTTTIEYTPGIVFKDCVPTYSVAPEKSGVTIDADSGLLTIDPAAASAGESYTVTATSSLDPGVTSVATVTIK